MRHTGMDQRTVPHNFIIEAIFSALLSSVVKSAEGWRLLPHLREILEVNYSNN